MGEEDPCPLHVCLGMNQVWMGAGGTGGGCRAHLPTMLCLEGALGALWGSVGVTPHPAHWGGQQPVREGGGCRAGGTGRTGSDCQLLLVVAAPQASGAVLAVLVLGVLVVWSRAEQSVAQLLSSSAQS